MQLLREGLSEKVHATIPKGIVGGFSLFIKEICKNGTRDHGLTLQLLKASNKSKFDSYSVRSSVYIISHITFQDCRVHIFSENLSRNICIWDHTSHC